MDSLHIFFEQVKIRAFVVVWTNYFLRIFHYRSEIVSILLFGNRKPACLFLAHHKDWQNFTFNAVEARYKIR